MALTQGRFRWCHDQVLTKLSEVLERCWVTENHNQETAKPIYTTFIKTGSTSQAPAHKRDTTLRPGKEWQMLVDLIRQWAFPREITTTTLWPEASDPYRFTL